MPRYYFHIRKDSHAPDKVGIELDDLANAQREAAVLLGQQIAQHPTSFWNDQEWHIEVTDATGLILFVLYSAAVRAPSMSDDGDLRAAPSVVPARRTV